MNKKYGIIILLIGCLTFVSFVYLKKTDKPKSDDVYLKTVVFKDKDNELIPISINFFSQVEREQEVINRLQLMKSNELSRYGLYPVLDSQFEVLSVKVKDKVMTLNTNEAIAKGDGLDVIEALTYVLTDYADVEQLKLQIQGKDIVSLPNSQIPLTSLTKQFGLNNFIETSLLLHETIPVMAYQEKIVQQYSYYIPTTLRIHEKDSIDEQVKTVLEHVQSQIQVIDASLENGILSVHLGSNILLDNETIDQTLQELIVLSLSSIKGVKDVSIHINKEELETKKTSEIQYNYLRI